MKANAQGYLARSTALAMTAVSLSGCVTGSTVERARTYSHTTKDGEVVVDQKGKPGYYALLPLTIPADIALAPVYLVYVVYCNVTGDID